MVLGLSLLFRPRMLNVDAGGGGGSSSSVGGADAEESGEGAAIAERLRAAIQKLYVEFVSAEGVDYDGMRESEAFRAYVAQTARLGSVDVARVLTTDAEKTAFFVNLYNAATVHAVVALGPPPRNSLRRLRYNATVGYRVGRDTFSLAEMENGVLRGNRAFYTFPAPFRAHDARRAACVAAPDARVHFALNCAAASCPPVLCLTPGNLAAALAGAAQSFLASADNFAADGAARAVALSSIFKWYRADFAPDGSDDALLAFVARNAPPDAPAARALAAMRQDAAPIRVRWLPYDWALNSV